MSRIGTGFIGTGFIGRALTFLTPSYWRGRAVFTNERPVASFPAAGAAASITLIPQAQATIASASSGQLTFEDLASQATFPLANAVAVIEDPDPTATIVT